MAKNLSKIEEFFEIRNDRSRGKCRKNDKFEKKMSKTGNKMRKNTGGKLQKIENNW